MQGSSDGVPLAVKLFNTHQRGATEAFTVEVHAYNTLKSLQGDALVHLLRYGILQECHIPTILLELVGRHGNSKQQICFLFCLMFRMKAETLNT